MIYRFSYQDDKLNPDTGLDDRSPSLEVKRSILLKVLSSIERRADHLLEFDISAEENNTH